MNNIGSNAINNNSKKQWWIPLCRYAEVSFSGPDFLKKENQVTYYLFGIAFYRKKQKVISEG
jgi:hypothetical protein